MTPFSRRAGSLLVEQVPLQTIAAVHGTPTYVYSRAAIEAGYNRYAEALDGSDHLVCYAVKANSNLAVLNLLARRGAGFDIVSVGELERVLAAGGNPAKVVFSGVGKRRDEMERALAAGIHCFNVESTAELARLSEVASACGAMARVSLRVNPDVDAETHPYISTGLRENKFGIDIAEAAAVYRRARDLPGLQVVGVDCHIGSQLTRVEPFLDALDRVLVLLDQLAHDGIHVRHLDLGGGLGVRYRDEAPPPVADYIGAIRERLAGRPLTLIVEPGRSIVANAGVLLTQVEYLKDHGGRHFAIVDAAMNDMLRPTLYDAWMGIEEVETGRGNPQAYDIVGPVCETGDFLGRERRLALGDDTLLVLHGAGAYGFTMSSNYNSRPRAAEIMVDGDRHYVVRGRETIAELMRGESTLP